MSDNVICSDQRHLIDRPVPEGITGIYLFKYEAEQALTSSASCDLPSSYGLSWQTNATGEWEFEWERPGGYGCGCPSAFWIKAEHLQFLNYLTSLIAPTGTAPQTPEAPLKTSPDDWTHLDSVPDPNKVSVELTREEAEALRELLDPFDLTPESEPGIIDSKLRSALGEGEK